MVAGSENERENKGQGEGRRGRTRKLEGEKRQKDESVGEMMGIKREMGQDNPGQR